MVGTEVHKKYFHLIDLSTTNRKFWEWVSGNFQINLEFVEKYYKNLNWREISKNKNVEEAVLNRYALLLHWDEVSRRGNLSNEFLKKFQDKIHWYDVYALQPDDLDDYFFERVENTSWATILRYKRNITLEFLSKFESQINKYKSWHWLFNNKFLKKEIFMTYFDKINACPRPLDKEQVWKTRRKQLKDE